MNNEESYLTKHSKSLKLQRKHQINIMKIYINFLCFLVPGIAVFPGAVKSMKRPDLPSEYIIITNQTLEEAFEPVADYITKKGVVAKIYTVDEILNNYSCDTVSNICDSAGAIRSFLMYKYENGTQWVLLGGDETNVPVRYGTATAILNSSVTLEPGPSDLYYSDLNGNWNGDGDEYFGEPRHDSIDVEPELYVGRIPCENPEDVANWFEKLVSYENPENVNYLTKFFWSAADQMRSYPDSVISIGSIPSGISHDLTMVETDDGYLPKGSDVIHKMNEHFGFFTSFGHGSPDNLTVSAPGYNNPSKYRNFLVSLDSCDIHWTNQGGLCRVENGNGLDSLKNKDYYGIMAIYSCYHAAYDFKNLDKEPWNRCCGPSIMEAFILLPERGGPAYIGFTREAGLTSNIELHNCLLNKLFHDNITRIGEAVALTKTEIYPNQLTYHSYNFFGCPLMRIWTDIPQKMNVSHDTLITTGPGNIMLTVSEDNDSTGIRNAYVCLWKGDEVYERGYTDENGHLQLQVNSITAGTMSITVTKENMLPYEGVVTVQWPEPKLLAKKTLASQSDRSRWHTVDFPETYINPIVFMGPPSYNDSNPTTIRVKDIESNGFKFQMEEWDYLDGAHGEETISFLAMEEGVYKIDGKIWEAGWICCPTYEEWVTVNFRSPDFKGSNETIVLTQPVTDSLDFPIVTRVKDVTSSGFKLMIQNEENNEDLHGSSHDKPEIVNYLALETGIGKINNYEKFAVAKTTPGQTPAVSHEWSTVEFPAIDSAYASIFIADIQTFQFDTKKYPYKTESDPASLRYKDLINTKVTVKVEEEQSADLEVTHPPEDIGYLAVFKPVEDTTVTDTQNIYKNYIELPSSIITESLVLNVSSAHDREVSIELIDITGRIIKRKNYKLKKGKEQPLNFGQFKSGIYFFRILQEKATKPEVYKITVLR